MDYLLSQLEKFYPIGSMPNSTYNNTSLYNQLVESSYGSSCPPMANSGQNGLPWTGYEYLQNNSLNPNNQYPPPPPDQYPLQHAPSLGVQPFYFPQPSAQPLFQKAPWLRNVILVDGKTASPPLPTPRAGHVTLCSSTIRVSGLPDKCTEQDLTVKFKNHGIVYSVTVSHFRHTCDEFSLMHSFFQLQIMRENGNRIALVCMKRRQHAKKAYDSFSKTLLLRKFFGPLITVQCSLLFLWASCKLLIWFLSISISAWVEGWSRADCAEKLPGLLGRQFRRCLCTTLLFQQRSCPGEHRWKLHCRL